MLYWVFHAEQLDKALATFEAARIQQGATEAQAKDDAAIVRAFLVSAEAAALRGN